MTNWEFEEASDSVDFCLRNGLRSGDWLGDISDSGAKADGGIRHSGLPMIAIIASSNTGLSTPETV